MGVAALSLSSLAQRRTVCGKPRSAASIPGAAFLGWGTPQPPAWTPSHLHPHGSCWSTGTDTAPRSMSSVCSCISSCSGHSCHHSQRSCSHREPWHLPCYQELAALPASWDGNYTAGKRCPQLKELLLVPVLFVGNLIVVVVCLVVCLYMYIGIYVCVYICIHQ